MSEGRRKIWVGIDSGGTFTDLVLWSESGLETHKLLSTPNNPAEAVLDGLRSLLSGREPSDEAPQALHGVVHGSTVATNTLLERTGARCAFITNRGFRDLLTIGRQQRPTLYARRVETVTPPVARQLSFGVGGRLDAAGLEIEPLKPDELRDLARTLRELGIDAIAICLLHAYANPAHEQAVARALGELGLPLSISSEILPETREVERAFATCVNAYVQPKMSRYLTALEQAIGERQLRVMQSDGGVASARLASRQPVRTILSGPAGGVNGALMMAKMAGMHRVLSFDMGGTSTDVSLCDGEPTITYEGRVGPHPVRLPMLDIHTVGAGGGSIAYLDLGGALRVGPRSAGAEPGPVCYARGGREPTVTDANLICGRMLADRFLGGRIRLDAAAAERALSGLATQAGLEALALAEGVLEVANVLMARALRVISVERGFDPREFALIAFGGAGGMHACALAEALEMRRILVPAHAGVLSALGMISADLTRRYVQMWLRPLDEVDHDALCGAFEALEARARDEMTDEGVANERLTLRRFVDLRYEGQSYELTLPLDDPRRASLHDSLRSRFGEAHEQRYGYRHEERPIELVALRLRAIGRVDKPQLAAAAASHAAMPERPHRIWLRGAWCDAVAVSRDALRVGGRLHGPALIADDHATTLLHPGWVALKDRFGSLLLNRKG